MDRLASVPRKVLLKKISDHLNTISPCVCPERTLDFTEQIAIDRLDEEMKYLIDNHFDNERDLVEAIEFLELSNINFTQRRVREAIEEKDFTIEEKLNLLQELSQQGSPQ